MMINTEATERAAELFGALSHVTRLEIVKLLSSGELSVGDIAVRLNLGQSSASQHLAALKRAGLVASTARGASHMYRIRGPRISKIVDLIDEFCDIHGLTGGAVDGRP